jgi:hypothetical protein
VYVPTHSTNGDVSTASAKERASMSRNVASRAAA